MKPAPDCVNIGEKSELLGEFKIDFDALREKEYKYFPFGKDFVLQINLHVPGKSRSHALFTCRRLYTRLSV